MQHGNNRDPCFLTDGDDGRYLIDLEDALARDDCRLNAYVLMANHVHLLVTSMADHDISRLMQGVGRRYVRDVNRAHGRSGTLWER